MGGGAMDSELGRSPGPVYFPSPVGYGRGPRGTGNEYTMAGRSFCAPLEQKRTREAERPGPKYMVPSAFTQQFESHKFSSTAGKFNASERKTMEDLGSHRSPGPAAYDTRPSPVKKQLGPGGGRSMRFMGSSMRFYPEPPVSKAFPGPGAYKLHGSVGGVNPAASNSPVVGFSKANLRNVKMIERSPGPIYDTVGSVGTQYSSDRRSAGRFGFGTASRFPTTGPELVDHMRAVHRVRGGVMPDPPRARRHMLNAFDAAADDDM